MPGEFHESFKRFTGHRPLRWQERLYGRFLRGEVPTACDLPTGTGKTSVMALWYLARRGGACLPRRLVYVVDRRAVVDQASEEAERIRCAVDDPGLRISTLRGQQQDNRRWLEDPAALAIIVGTVDMIGSRLLFSGYGVSRKMAPFHAGLLGTDVLFVLDEAHLVPPFQHLLEAVSGRAREFGPAEEADRPRIPGVRLLSLSATGRGSGGDVFRLEGEDSKDEFIANVVGARKCLRVEALGEGTKLPAALKARALDLAGRHDGARIGVFCNGRKEADETRALLVRAGARTVMLAGERRVRERERAAGELEESGFLPRAGEQEPHGGASFLVATAAGEVGIDLDADHMVCDLVAWERMVQRLGRVNRRGGAGRVAEVVVLDQGAPKLGQKPGPEALAAVARHKAVRKLLDEIGDASPAGLRAFAEQHAQEVQAASSAEELRPPLTRALVDAWSLTSLEEHPGRPEVGPWLRGWISEAPQTTVIWREHLPVLEGGGAAGKADLKRFFEAARPHLSEGLEAETWRVLGWACARAAQLDGGAETAFALRGGVATPIRANQLRELDKKAREEFSGALAGARLVVPASWGGLSEAGLLEEGANRPVIAADGAAPEEWLGYAAGGEPRVPFRVRRQEAEAGAEEDWVERFRLVVKQGAEGDPLAWLSVQQWGAESDGDDDAAEGRNQLLSEHVAAVEKHAGDLLNRLQVGAELADAVRLAAHLHDEGKRSTRWQRAFHAPGGGQVWGKTRGPIDFKTLDHYRHEFGSLLRVADSEELLRLPEAQRDLVLHLIAAHHGWARPVIGTSGCEELPPTAPKLTARARDAALRFARLQRRWGPWGLAWLEALLRAADQAASRENDAGRRSASAAGGGD